MIERERKFLLNPDWEKDVSEAPRVTIQQGYLMLEENNQLRVRIITGREGDKRGYLCFKRCNTAIERLEFEYQIPVVDAYALMQLAKIKLIKERISVKTDKYTIDVDFYPDGLVVVEVEFAEGVEYIPDICGKEITGVKEYSNIEIAKKQSSRGN